MARMQYRCFDLTVFFVLILSLNVRHPGKTNTHLRKNAFAKNFIFHFDISNTQTFHTLQVMQHGAEVIVEIVKNQHFYGTICRKNGKETTTRTTNRDLQCLFEMSNPSI